MQVFTHLQCTGYMEQSMNALIRSMGITMTKNKDGLPISPNDR